MTASGWLAYREVPLRSSLPSCGGARPQERAQHRTSDLRSGAARLSPGKDAAPAAGVLPAAGAASSRMLLPGGRLAE
jgi:hypothetical protein